MISQPVTPTFLYLSRLPSCQRQALLSPAAYSHLRTEALNSLRRFSSPRTIQSELFVLPRVPGLEETIESQQNSGTSCLPRHLQSLAPILPCCTAMQRTLLLPPRYVNTVIASALRLLDEFVSSNPPPAVQYHHGIVALTSHDALIFRSFD